MTDNETMLITINLNANRLTIFLKKTPRTFLIFCESVFFYKNFTFSS